jgi:hypothetical protein
VNFRIPVAAELVLAMPLEAAKLVREQWSCVSAELVERALAVEAWKRQVEAEGRE